MNKKVNIILAAVEVVGLLIIFNFIPADTTGQIIGKTAAGLVWLGLYYVSKRILAGKLGERDENKEDQ